MALAHLLSKCSVIESIGRPRSVIISHGLVRFEASSD